jgi:MFS family permease
MIIIASALQAGSVNITMFLISRTFGGMAVGSILVAVPLYQSEIAPAHLRGTLVAMHGMVRHQRSA